MAMLPTAETLAVLSQNGGTRKTTTVLTLADALRRAGLTCWSSNSIRSNLSDYFDVPGGRRADHRRRAALCALSSRRTGRGARPDRLGEGRSSGSFRLYSSIW